MVDVVTRFAPSPTGYLHIGGVRTALFNYVFAKKFKGKFLVRIEDTDKERSKEEYIKAIMDGLNWVGIQPDLEPIKQSDRYDVYQKEADRLVEEGKAYKDEGAIRLKVDKEGSTLVNDHVYVEISDTIGSTQSIHIVEGVRYGYADLRRPNAKVSIKK